MITVTLRDLQWRARRFVIAGMGAAMVFALTLVLAGLTASFSAESRRVVDAVGADAWLVQSGVESVFSSVSVVPVRTAQELNASPLWVSHHTVPVGGRLLEVQLLGYAPGGLGQPPLAEGRLPAAPDEVVADRVLGVALGQSFELAEQPVRVVGRTRGLTINAGQALVFTRITDAQRLFAAGAPVASALLTRGVPETVPDGLGVRTREQTRQDLLRPLAGAISSLKAMLVLLWAVAALVIGSVVYLSALERRRDFAVYKATGWSTTSLALGLAVEAALLSTMAAAVGVVVAQLLLPLFPMNFEVPDLARALLPVVGLVVGLVSSVVGLRKAVGVEPAAAFGGP